MSKCYASAVLKTAAKEVGYLEKKTNSQLDDKTANAGTGNFTKYARDFDTKWPRWYNGAKNGYAYCDVFVDWCFVTTYGYDDALRLLCQPERSLGAGCTFSLGYYKAKGKLYTKNPKPGDQIFFGSSQSDVDHTGIVEKVDANKVYTIEGNTSDMVARRTYSLTDSYIVGYGRPDYDPEEVVEAPVTTPTEPHTGEETGTVERNGIDVSFWQGDIDWKRVKADGIDFAMIRLGYGSSDGTECGLDSHFEKNVQNAVKAGVDIGCYFYSYAMSVAAAKKEAAFVTGVLRKYPGVFTYPVAFDIENDSQAKLGKTVATNMVIEFCDAVEKAGFYATVYSNLNWLRNYLDDAKLARFDHWLAQWASAPSYDGTFGLWQYSSTGKVNGINGNVDRDTAYMDYPTIIRNAKLNGFSGETAPTVPDTPAEKSKDVEYTVKGDTLESIAKAYNTTREALALYNNISNPDMIYVGQKILIPQSVPPEEDKPTPTPTPAPTPVIETGDIVQITGTKYYDGTSIPSFIRDEKWIVYESTAGSDRVVINKSTDGVYAIMSPVNRKDLKLLQKH